MTIDSMFALIKNHWLYGVIPGHLDKTGSYAGKHYCDL